MLCKGTARLIQDTFLGTSANATGDVEVSLARLGTGPPREMKQAALTRAERHAEEDAWGAWGHALSDADDWETQELEYIPPSM